METIKIRRKIEKRLMKLEAEKPEIIMAIAVLLGIETGKENEK